MLVAANTGPSVDVSFTGLLAVQRRRADSLVLGREPAFNGKDAHQHGAAALAHLDAQTRPRCGYSGVEYPQTRPRWPDSSYELGYVARRRRVPQITLWWAVVDFLDVYL